MLSMPLRHKRLTLMPINLTILQVDGLLQPAFKGVLKASQIHNLVHLSH